MAALIQIGSWFVDIDAIEIYKGQSKIEEKFVNFYRMKSGYEFHVEHKTKERADKEYNLVLASKGLIKEATEIQI